MNASDVKGTGLAHFVQNAPSISKGGKAVTETRCRTAVWETRPNLYGHIRAADSPRRNTNGLVCLHHNLCSCEEYPLAAGRELGLQS